MIKRKGQNPQYNQQRQQRPPAPAGAPKLYQSSTSNQKGQKKRGNAAGKKKNQPPYHHTHEAVNDTSDGDYGFVSSLGVQSLTVTQPPPPPITGATVAEIGSKTITTRKAPVNLSTKAFTKLAAVEAELAPCNLVYKEFRDAIETCRINEAPVTARNVAFLEHIFENKKKCSLTDRLESPPKKFKALPKIGRASCRERV